jgi:enamine deaminase RidA (YjgF/YER057c/UK114 family)
MNTQPNSRRNLLRAGAGVATLAVAASQTRAATDKPAKKVHYKGAKPAQPGLFNGCVSYGNLVFVAGKGAHFPGDIKAHTERVLDEIKKELENAGSNMDCVLKCNVYLNDLKDYAAMNDVFRGKFGAEPPVRTTIAAAAGIPGNSLVEIDVIAYIPEK